MNEAYPAELKHIYNKHNQNKILCLPQMHLATKHTAQHNILTTMS